MIFADSNIFIDIITLDADWKAWSSTSLDRALLESDVIINPVIAAELAPQFSSADDLEDYFTDFGVISQPLSWRIAYAAGQAHSEYRRRGGERQSIPADFLIGSHAQILGASILTRDPKRFRSYFPDLTLITPETHP